MAVLAALVLGGARGRRPLLCRLLQVSGPRPSGAWAEGLGGSGLGTRVVLPQARGAPWAPLLGPDPRLAWPWAGDGRDEETPQAPEAASTRW